jgi:HK97 family phage prohead protease
MNEVVEQSWDLDNYKANPVVLWGHDPSNPDNVLGKAIEIVTEKEGDRKITTAKVQFAEEGTSRGVDVVWSLIKQGILKTVSVGFIPHTFKDGDADSGIQQILADNELLEFSIVPIPANPNAVALAFGDESIGEKDAKWLVKQYKAEQTFLEKAMYDSIKSNQADKNNDKGAKAMTDEEITKLAEALGVAVADAINPKLEEILTAVTGEEAETEEEEEELDEDAKSSKNKDNDSANSEQDDEDGADDDSEDVDTEVDEEA